MGITISRKKVTHDSSLPSQSNVSKEQSFGPTSRVTSGPSSRPSSEPSSGPSSKTIEGGLRSSNNLWTIIANRTLPSPSSRMADIVGEAMGRASELREKDRENDREKGRENNREKEVLGMREDKGKGKMMVRCGNASQVIENQTIDCSNDTEDCVDNNILVSVHSVDEVVYFTENNRPGVRIDDDYQE